jgi:transposase-like protein
MADGKKCRQRRSFTDEFKAEVVKKVLTSGKTAGQVARDLDLTETAVRGWSGKRKSIRGRDHPARSPRPRWRSSPGSARRTGSSARIGRS